MLETGRCRYARAFDLYFTAIVVPTGVVNAITMACLKKLYLISLLINGEAPTLPKYTSVPVLRTMKTECAAYIELAKVAATASTAAAGNHSSGGGGGTSAAAAAGDLAAFATSKAEIWSADGNTGLVCRVIETESKRKVRALTNTFSSLSAAGVAERAGLSTPRESELEILRMIESGEVNARMNERDGMAEFGTHDSDVFASTEAASKLEELLHRCMEMSAVVAEVDHSVSCDRAFISKTEAGKNALGGSGRIDLGQSGGMLGGSLGGSGEDLPFLVGGVGGGGSGGVSEGQEGLPMSSPAVELIDNLDDNMV
jgi:COP9 signalosome complex subunit 3